MARRGKRKGDREEKEERESSPSFWSSLREETRYSILGILFVILGLIFLIAPFGSGGLVGGKVYTFFTYLFGIGYYLIPFIFFLVGVNFFRAKGNTFAKPVLISSFLFVLSGLGLLSLLHSSAIGGGMIGYGVEKAFAIPFGNLLAAIILIGLEVMSLLILFDTPLHFGIITRLFKRQPALVGVEEDMQQEEIILPVTHGTLETQGADENDADETEVATPKPLKPIKEKPAPIKKEDIKPIGKEEIAAIAVRRVSLTYVPPPLSLLAQDKGKPGYGDVKVNGNIIQRTLQNFGVNVEMDEVSVGPSVTRYALKPAEGTKLSRIVELQRELSYALAADPIRIEAPIPGKSLVGIEIPNTQKATVGLAALLGDPEFVGNHNPLTIALGKGISGKGEYSNIAKMPHALIAGATGSGKSVTIHTLITSLLYRNSPEELRFIMIDPKRVELTLYNGIPHLLTPVITDAKKSILTLKWATKEMERRYEVLQSTASRDIQSYHKNILIPAIKKLEGKTDEEKIRADLPESLPYIVIIIDELADLMSLYPRELEGAIVRLAQMSRAVGIHLILSTQRPSVNVITGLIKANVPSRVALQVASQIDSRTILDQAGAEKLLGAGDMLYISGDMAKPKRIQSAFISENEVKSIVSWIKEHCDSPLDELNLSGDKPEGSVTTTTNAYGGIPDDALMDDDSGDELYEEAKNTVIEAKKASTSFLQRKLGVGYSRAAKLMDILEEKGVIGPADGSKPREILVGGGESSPSHPEE